MTTGYMARWIVTFVAALLIIALLAFARGDEERGAEPTDPADSAVAIVV